MLKRGPFLAVVLIATTSAIVHSQSAQATNHRARKPPQRTSKRDLSNRLVVGSLMIRHLAEKQKRGVSQSVLGRKRVTEIHANAIKAERAADAMLGLAYQVSGVEEKREQSHSQTPVKPRAITQKMKQAQALLSRIGQTAADIGGATIQKIQQMAGAVRGSTPTFRLGLGQEPVLVSP